MPDTTDLQAPAWPAPDPQLAEALRAYGFEATPPPIDDEPETDVRPAVGLVAAPEPVDVVPAASDVEAWWVEAPATEAAPPAPVPAPVASVPQALPRPVATPMTPAAAVGPTPPAFLAGRIARTPADGATPRPGPSPEAEAGLAGLAAFATAAPPPAVAMPGPEVAEPIAPEPIVVPTPAESIIAEPALADADAAVTPAELSTEVATAEPIALAEPLATADDPRAAIAWPEPQPLDDEQWRNAGATALPADPWSAPPTVEGPGFAFEPASDAAIPDQASIVDPWAGIRFSADDEPGMAAEALPAGEPGMAAEALPAGEPGMAAEALPAGEPGMAAEARSDEALPDWPGPDATTSPWGEPASSAQVASSPSDVLDAGATEGFQPDATEAQVTAGAWPIEDSAAPHDGGAIPTDAWASPVSEAPLQADLLPAEPMPWSDAIPAEHAPWESEPVADALSAAPAEPIAADLGGTSDAWAVAPGVRPAAEPQVDLSGVEFLGYQDDVALPPSSLPPVVAPAVAAQDVPIPAPAPGVPASDPYRRSIAEIGRRPPGARPVTGAPAPVPTPVSSGERTPPPDPAAASGATATATGADLWDLVTAPGTPAPAPVPAPKKASRVTTVLLTVLVVLVILALVLGFLWSFTDLIR